MALETLDDTAPPETPDIPAAIPLGATGASSAGGALSALDPYGQDSSKIIDGITPDRGGWRAFAAGALTPGNFGASMQGALGGLNSAKDKEAELKLRYMPIVEQAMQQRQQRQIAVQAAQRAQDIGYQNAALGAIAPLLAPGQTPTKQAAMQALQAAVQTGRVPATYAQNLFATLPDDPAELRAQLTGQVQAAVDPFSQHLTKLSPGQSLVNPLTGTTSASLKKYDVQKVDQGDQTTLMAVNPADPTDSHVIGSYKIGTSPDAELRAKMEKYTADSSASTSRANTNATISKDFAIAGMNPDGTPRNDVQAQIKAIGEYRQKAPSMATRNPRNMAIMDAVNAQYPAFDATQYDARQQAAKAFSTGKDAQSVQSANTALNHLDTIKKLAIAEKNHDIPALNAIYNGISQQFGGAAPTNMQTAVAMVAPELVKAVVGASGGSGERENMAKLFSANAGPDQLLGAANQAQELLGGRLSEVRRTYHRTTGRNDFEDQFLSPAAADILKARESANPTAAATAKTTAIPSVQGFSYVGPAGAKP